LPVAKKKNFKIKTKSLLIKVKRKLKLTILIPFFGNWVLPVRLEAK